jgi:hypothetical protein
MITADGGGSNGSRVRLWKVELQKFADETGLTLQIHHYPPGTSKWNKIEHRLFCHITQNWRGKPLVSHQVILDLIGATTTKTGLEVRCELDPRTYEKGIKVTNAEMEALNIQGAAFHPGRVEDRRAGLGRCLSFLLSRPFVLRVSQYLDHATSPAPSSSNAAGEFLALRSPICFAPRLIGPILLGRL